MWAEQRRQRSWPYHEEAVPAPPACNVRPVGLLHSGGQLVQVVPGKCANLLRVRGGCAGAPVSAMLCECTCQCCAGMPAEPRGVGDWGKLTWEWLPICLHAQLCCP